VSIAELILEHRVGARSRQAMVRPALLLLPVLQSAATDPSKTEVVEAIKYQFSPIEAYCLVPNYGDKQDLATGVVELSPWEETSTMKDCAALCTQTDACKTWSFVETATGIHKCYDLTLRNADFPGSVPLHYNVKAMTGLDGACACPSTPKMALTGGEFPAADPATYKDLFELALHQPAPLMCWPKDERGKIKPAEAVVQRSNQVDPSDPKYFQGWCTGMTAQTLEAGDDCAALCREQADCNGYQTVPPESQRPSGCFFGAGYDCDNKKTWNGGVATDDAAAQAVVDADASADGVETGMKAERFERGFVKVIATVTKWQILGLTKRFDDTAFQIVATSRRLGTDWALLSTRCKEVCTSDIWCSVWQVYDGTQAGLDAGCYTEAQGDLDYPMGRSASEVVNYPDGGIYDGEFIQHWYSEDVTTTTTTTTSPPQPNRLLPILLGLAGLAALLGLGAYAMGWCSPKEKVKKPRAKRALQQPPEPPKEEPKPEPVPTQPSFLMSAPVLTYTAAPVTYAAPVATMQAAPLTYAAPPVTTASYQVVQGASTMPYSTSVVVPQEPVQGFMG